jgi:hypothetical protein
MGFIKNFHTMLVLVLRFKGDFWQICGRYIYYILSIEIKIALGVM